MLLDWVHRHFRPLQEIASILLAGAILIGFLTAASPLSPANTDPAISPWGSLSGKFYITAFAGSDGKPFFVEYQRVGDLGIFQGDIVLGKFEDLQKQLLYSTQALSGEAIARAVAKFPELPEQLQDAASISIPFGFGLKSITQLWPQRTVPYSIGNDVPPHKREQIEQAVKQWNDTGAIKLIDIDTLNRRTLGRVGYILIQSATRYDCHSDGLGRNSSGVTRLHIGENCAIGTIVHELGHALGLGHEHLRQDRSTWIHVDLANITKKAKAQIDYCEWRRADNLCDPIYRSFGKYDLCSIMHYPGNLPRLEEWLVDIQGNDNVFQLTEQGNAALDDCSQQFSDKNCHTLGQLCGPSKGDTAAITEMYKNVPWVLSF